MIHCGALVEWYWQRNLEVREGILCFVDSASLYNLVNKANLVHKLFLVYLFSVHLSTSTCFGRLCAHHQEKQCVYATLGSCYCVWMTVWYAGFNLHTRQSSTHNNKNQVSHKHTVSPDDGHIVARNMYNLINILRINVLSVTCTPVWLYLQDYIREACYGAALPVTSSTWTDLGLN